MPHLVASVLCGVVMLGVLNPLYLAIKRRPGRGIATFVKGACTGLGLALALWGALAASSPFGWWMVAGLALCLLGDVLIVFSLVPGMAAFLLGHIGYMIAFCMLAPPRWISLPVFAVLLAVVALLFRSTFHAMGKLTPAYVAYAAVLLAMLSLALALPAGLGARGWVVALGALLFTLSDLTLARGLLVKATPLGDAVCLTLYYGAQFTLALSVFFPC